MTEHIGERVALRCPVHGIPDCSPLLNGCSILNALHAAYEQGHVEGYEKGLTDPGSAWMKANQRELDAAKAEALRTEADLIGNDSCCGECNGVADMMRERASQYDPPSIRPGSNSDG